MDRTFSLVLATVGRFSELDAFLQSLVLQEYKKFTCIIVDQNAEETYLQHILQKYEGSLDIVHLRSARGLSRARNVGLQHCTGNVVCFPDDDCLYPPSLLKDINTAFDAEYSDVLVGRQIPLELTAQSAQSGLIYTFGSHRTQAHGGETVYSLFMRAPSITLFFTRAAVVRTGQFDERLGAGAGTPWGSGEDTDYVVRACKNGCVVRRCPQLEVQHPDVVYEIRLLPKARAYGRGRGRLLRKHHFNLFFCVLNVAYPLMKALCALPNTTAAAFFCQMALGRLEGLLDNVE